MLWFVELFGSGLGFARFMFIVSESAILFRNFGLVVKQTNLVKHNFGMITRKCMYMNVL